MKYWQARKLAELLREKFRMNEDITDMYRLWMMDMPYVATARALDLHLRYGMTPPSKETLQRSAVVEASTTTPPRSRVLIAREESARWAAHIRKELSGDLPSTGDRSTVQSMPSGSTDQSPTPTESQSPQMTTPSWDVISTS